MKKQRERKPSYFRQIYYEALYFVINTIQKCFEILNHQTYVALENLLIEAANNEHFSKEHTFVIDFNDIDIVTARLKLYLKNFTEVCAKLHKADLQSMPEYF